MGKVYRQLRAPLKIPQKALYFANEKDVSALYSH